MLRVRHLGAVPYGEALDLQRSLVSAADDYLLVLEHPAVYTAGVRTDPGNVLVPAELLGADLVTVDRGGDVTFHGPGQVVCYPIVSVADHPGAGKSHVERLEDAVIEVVRASLPEVAAADVGLLEDHPGVWVTPRGSVAAKVAAVGVRTTRLDDGRRRTSHGIALNVDVGLEWFARWTPQPWIPAVPPRGRSRSASACFDAQGSTPRNPWDLLLESPTGSGSPRTWGTTTCHSRS